LREYAADFPHWFRAPDAALYASKDGCCYVWSRALDAHQTAAWALKEFSRPRPPSC